MAITNLSIGLLIRDLLAGSEEVTNITRTIYPVMATDVKLPFVSYQRTGFSSVYNTGGNADTVTVEVTAWADNYDEAILLAEAIRTALEDRRASAHGVTMRGCYLAESDEGYASDAYYVRLIFTIRAN